MEKPRRSVASIISFLPKRASFSRDGNAHAHVLQQRRGFIGSIVPVEVRRKGKGGARGEFEEPTSPKVTCMGQVKLRKMRCNSNRETKSTPPPAKPAAEKRLKSKRTGDVASLFLRRIFHPRRRKAAASAEEEKEICRGDINPASAPALALGTMRRYASGRETLRYFDRRNAEESGREEEDDGALVAHSGPIILGSSAVVAMDPKKMPPPPPPIPRQL